jgi:diguanylate cyclase (GGDEF)-like protein/PAS domain S-box-containing protein
LAFTSAKNGQNGVEAGSRGSSQPFTGGYVSFLYFPYALPGFAAALIALALSSYVFLTRKQHDSPGARTFSGFMLSTGIWSLATAMTTLSHFTGQVFWAKVGYIAIATLPPLWFVFVLQQRGNLNRSVARWLFVIPALTIILVWTNEFHHIFWLATSFDQNVMPPAFETVRGFWFWGVHTLYSYGLLVSSILLLLWQLRNTPPSQRAQLVLLISAVSVPLVINGLYIMGFRLLGSVDPTSLAFAISGTFIAFALFRFQLLRLEPIAFRTVFENLPDAIIVLDGKSTIVSLNTAAKGMLGNNPHLIGKDINTVIENWSELVARYNEAGQPNYQVLFNFQGLQRHLNVSSSLLHNTQGKFIGSVVVARDISESKAFQEQAYRDPLTNLANRRMLELEGELLFANCVRSNQPLSVLYMDLDGFKGINDKHGHKTGDFLLQYTSERLRGCVRNNDLLVRLGGDEFVVVLPNANRERALEVMERIRVALERPFGIAGEQLAVSASIGLALYPDDARSLGELLEKADTAMYKAKHRRLRDTVSK